MTRLLVALALVTGCGGTVRLDDGSHARQVLHRRLALRGFALDSCADWRLVARHAAHHRWREANTAYFAALRTATRYHHAFPAGPPLPALMAGTCP